MSENKDGNATETRTAQNLAGTRSETIGKTFPRTEGCSIGQSEVIRIQGHITDDQGTGIRRNRDKSIHSTSADPGKILEAVKLIEEKHLSYVRAHQQRLTTRLDESKERESEFKKAIQELEAQIYQLISEKEEPQ